ncbi:hypothetical protein [Terasakiella pusilla]|uniref:hypothetical protein n=1 Tax=Terasakiella pusilla TaxID=64973 RepID=UPI003AA969A4
MTKITIGAIGVLLLACGLLFWMYDVKASEAAMWEEAHSALKTENQKFQLELAEHKDRLAQTERISTERERKRAALHQQNRNLQQHLKELAYAQPEINSYLDQPIPPDLLGSLRQYAAPDGSALDRESVSAGTLANPMPLADDPGEPDR